MSQSQTESETFNFKPDYGKLHTDVLRFILLKILPRESEPLLNELKKVFDEQAANFESGDLERLNTLKCREHELVQALISLGSASAKHEFR